LGKARGGKRKQDGRNYQPACCPPSCGRASAKAESLGLIQRGEEASTKIDLDEAATRALIDQQLSDNGWEADTKALRHGIGARPVKGRNLAIAEWPTASGPADYALFVGLTLVGVVEAKRKRKNVSASIDQAEHYSSEMIASVDFSFAEGGPWGKHKVPFVFAANGRSYLKQIETESGIWFRDTRRSVNHRRALVSWPTPYCDACPAHDGNFRRSNLHLLLSAGGH
jgi:type I restriction enzyme, R subunit